MATYFYAETDGEVFLVERDGVLSFPESEREFPCPVERRFSIPVLGHTVWFCKPVLDKHPSWVYKDTISELPDVSPVVRKAVDQSQPRCVAAGVILRDSAGRPLPASSRGAPLPFDAKVCLVKAKRGHTTGYWNLPGGFVDYGENPRDTVRRELKEELAADVDVGDLLGTYEAVFPNTGRFMIAFVYLCTTSTELLVPAEDEIEAVGWYPPDEAARLTRNPFSLRALADLRDQRRKG